MASRFKETFVIDGDKVKADLKALGIDAKTFWQSIGISHGTWGNAMNGLPLSPDVEDKITRGLFKPTGYYRKQTPKPEPVKTEKAVCSKDYTENFEDITNLLDDIKATNEQILAVLNVTAQQFKSMVTLQARLLALWEGERHDAKGSNSEVLKKTS